MTKKDPPWTPHQDNQTGDGHVLDVEERSGMLGSIWSLLAQISARDAMRTARRTPRKAMHVSEYRGYRIAIGQSRSSYYVGSIGSPTDKMDTPAVTLDTVAHAEALAKGMIDQRLKQSK